MEGIRHLILSDKLSFHTQYLPYFLVLSTLLTNT